MVGSCPFPLFGWVSRSGFGVLGRRALRLAAAGACLDFKINQRVTFFNRFCHDAQSFALICVTGGRGHFMTMFASIGLFGKSKVAIILGLVGLIAEVWGCFCGLDRFLALFVVRAFRG